MYGPSSSSWNGASRGAEEAHERSCRAGRADRRVGVCRLVRCAVVMSLALPAAAPASVPLWGRPHRLSPPGARNAAVAVDARKDGIVAWSRPDLQQGNDRIEAAIRSGRSWGAVGLIGRANPLMGQSPVVAMDGRSDAYVGWIDSADNALHIAIHAPASPWAESVVGDTARQAQIAVGDAGDAAAAWVHLGRVEFARRPRDGVWSAPVVLSSLMVAADSPRLAMSASGDAFVLWLAGAGGAQHAQASVQPAGQLFGPVQTLSAANVSVTSPDIASDADGDAVAAWTVVSRSPKVVQAAARRVGQAGFDAPAAVATRAAISPVDVAVGPHGRAVVTWVSRFVEAAERTPAGRWTKPRRMSGPGDSILSPAQAVADRVGDKTIVWSGSSRVPRRLEAVHAADRLRGGPWRAAQVVSAAAEQDPGAAAVALGSRNNGLLAWRSLMPRLGFVIWAAPRRAR
jgi:hypothetical protein